MEDLAQYLRRLTPKSRLMVFLLSSGEFSLDEIRKMTVFELRSWQTRIPVDNTEIISAFDELCLHQESGCLAFTTPSGRPYSAKNVSDILVRSHAIAGVDFKGLSDFVARTEKV